MVKKVFIFIISCSLLIPVGLYARGGGGSSCGTSSAKTISGGEKLKKATPSVTRREVRQKARIAEGVKTGELTKDEAKGLVESQNEIREMKQGAREDGVVTKEERLELQEKLNQQSREIYKKKNN